MWFKNEKKVTAALTDFINLAAPLRLSDPTCVRHPAPHPGVSNDLWCLFAMTDPKASIKLIG